MKYFSKKAYEIPLKYKDGFVENMQFYSRYIFLVFL